MTFSYKGIAKKCASPSNEFLLHKCRNNGKIKKFTFFSNRKKCTSSANEFLLHECRNDRKMIFFLSNLNKLTMSFRYINAETKTKKLIFPLQN